MTETHRTVYMQYHNTFLWSVKSSKLQGYICRGPKLEAGGDVTPRSLEVVFILVPEVGVHTPCIDPGATAVAERPWR